MAGQFVYCIEAVGTGLAKVGCARNPRLRVGEFKTLVPYELRFRHVLRFPTIVEAFNAERAILDRVERVRGEWVRLDDELDALVLGAAGATGVLVTNDFLETSQGGRRPEPLTEDEARLVRRVALAPPAKDPRLAIAMDAIEAGFGWEDVLVKHSIPREVYWAAAARLAEARPADPRRFA